MTASRQSSSRLIAVICALAVGACGGTRTTVATTHSTRSAPVVSLADFIADSTFAFHTLRGPALTLSLNAGCGQGRALTAEYDEQRGADLISPVYSGPVHCRFAKDLRTGTLTAHWGRSLTLNMALTVRGSSHVFRSHPSSGCDSTDLTGSYDARGTLEDHVDAGALGGYERSRITVSVTTIVASQTQPESAFSECMYSVGGSSAPKLATKVVPEDALSTFGNEQIEGTGGHGGTPGLDLDVNLPDHIATGVTAEVLLELHDRGVFRDTPDLSAATLNADSPFSSGTISYRARVRCTGGHHATAGRLTGTITINGPVRATVTGADLGPAALAGPTGDVGGCPGVLG